MTMKQTLRSLLVWLSCAIGFAGALAGQQTLTTTYAINGGGAAGNAEYFTLTTGLDAVTIHAIDFGMLGGPGLAGTIDVYTTPGGHAGNETNASVWTLAATCTITSSIQPGNPTPSTMSAPLAIPANTSVGIAYVASTSLALSMTVATAPHPFSYSACGLTLQGGSATNFPWAGSVFIPRLPNTTLYYSVAGDCSGVETIGTGCYGRFASAYQESTLDVFAQGNTMSGIDFFNTSAGYLILPAVQSAPSIGSLDPFVLPIPSVGDDIILPVGTLGLTMCTNGWLATGPGNSNAWVPTPALLLDQPSEQFSFWSDFQPNAGGSIYYEESGTRALLTFDDVFAWGTTDPNTFQFDYDSATGDCSLYFGSLSSSVSHPILIGYSPGGPNLDPGSVDIAAELSANGAIVMTNSDTLPLRLDPVGNPIQLAAASDWDLTTSDFEAGALLHVGMLGVANPGLPLDVIGLPSACTLYASPNVILPPVVITGQSSHTWTALTLPPVTQPFAGFELYAQAFTLDTSLQFDAARASNGVKGLVGSL